MSDPRSLAADVARKLGGRSVLNADIHSQADLARMVQQRLPLAALKNAAKAGLTEHEIEAFVIPHRTRRHRAERNQPLTIDESDRAVRMIRIQSLAEQTFVDIDRANRWLRQPLAELSGNAPLTLAQTDAGARVVETILAKIAWGAAA